MYFFLVLFTTFLYHSVESKNTIKVYKRTRIGLESESRKIENKKIPTVTNLVIKRFVHMFTNSVVHVDMKNADYSLEGTK